jgi:hypothetical protein
LTKTVNADVDGLLLAKISLKFTTNCVPLAVTTAEVMVGGVISIDELFVTGRAEKDTASFPAAS